MDEFELIATYFRPLAASFPGALGLRDDAALLTPRTGEEFVVTADAIVAGVHFIADEDAALIARRLLRVNLSDLAGKGAAPLCYFITAALPRETDEAWIARFATGLAEDQQAFGIHLAGGDTTATPGPLTLSLTAIGTVPKGAMLTRGGAKVGDDIYVSGTLGEAAASQWRRLPEPRLALGLQLRGITHACMDISDGLAQDLGHICKASNVAAVIEAAAVPRNGADIETALSGGDDYELLFTAQPGTKLPNGITRIGRIEKGTGVTVLDAMGNPMQLAKSGYRHFRD